MTNTKKLATLALASLLSAGFMTATANAQNSDSKPMEKSASDHMMEKHACKGMNSCKGKGGCKAGDNGCKGKNSCKGKGGCATDGSKKAE